MSLRILLKKYLGVSQFFDAQFAKHFVKIREAQNLYSSFGSFN